MWPCLSWDDTESSSRLITQQSNSCSDSWVLTWPQAYAGQVAVVEVSCRSHRQRAVARSGRREEALRAAHSYVVQRRESPISCERNWRPIRERLPAGAAERHTLPTQCFDTCIANFAALRSTTRVSRSGTQSRSAATSWLYGDVLVELFVLQSCLQRGKRFFDTFR